MAERRFRQQREKSEFDHKVLDIRRVARVVAGGRRFTFRATVVVGNHLGKVGVGIAKGVDVSQAVEKANRQAVRNIIEVPLTREMSVPHDVEGKFSSAYVRLKPAKVGRGIVAGGAMRVVLAMAGVRDATAKILSRSGNKLNVARATLEAFQHLKKVPYEAKKPQQGKGVMEEKK